MAAAAAISLSFHFRFRPPFPSPRTPTRHAPFSLFSPSLLAPCRLRVAPGRPSPSPWRPDVRARAGSTIGAPPALVRPGGAVETDRLPSDVRDRAMEAVDHFGGRVTIGDVASRAGLQLAQAERALQALAADTEGFLEVSEDGEVLYVFPKDYRAKLAGKSFRMRVEPLVDKAKQVGAYLVRVSFGTALIASIVLVYTTIIAILSSSSTSSSTSSDEDGRGRRRRSYGSTIIIPTDMFWYLDADYYRRRRVENENGMNFIESVFSFVFGDGDPNDGLEEKRWKMVFPFSFEKILDSIFHQMVELLQLKNWHHFLMCHLHQKSPRHGNSCPKTMNHLFFQFFYAFRDIQKLMSRSIGSFQQRKMIKEHAMFEEEEGNTGIRGNILYRFPSLQRTASSKSGRSREYVGTKWSAMFSGVEKYLEEKPWKFRSVYIITILSEVELIQDAICPLRGKVCLGFSPSLTQFIWEPPALGLPYALYTPTC
ncbi:hypothetical protein Zm00014a_044669 [Zea mays]|uniref:Iron-sulfur cluster biosynthesis family protein n=2 Tax=Zea mays TaxID=4577 RepID=A0A979HL84_MAIZE|nr:Iron-sulfur cluster biosynthesis family protein [Zea mays]PWZ22589.1 Uncharacterized protein Zm00014a_044669 [Zea mays]PWZ22590.1 hypothetical protein Zm00014a_044669 [Zea mays]